MSEDAVARYEAATAQHAAAEQQALDNGCVPENLCWDDCVAVAMEELEQRP